MNLALGAALRARHPGRSILEDPAELPGPPRPYPSARRLLGRSRRRRAAPLDVPSLPRSLCPSLAPSPARPSLPRLALLGDEDTQSASPGAAIPAPPVGLVVRLHARRVRRRAWAALCQCSLGGGLSF